MTALKKYQRLECSGLWREAPGAQRREVIVTFGDATLILKESPSERALTHWSLPAVIRRNPGQMPALFLPGPESGEELELDDETMIAAISKVHMIIDARRPRPGRLRGALLLSVALATAGVALLWLPGAMIRHTASVLPDTTRTAVGQAILDDLERLTGRPCAEPEGSAALAALGEKLGTPALVVLPDGLQTSLHLPGGIIAVGRPLIERFDNPEVVAGYILAEKQRAEASDPLRPALSYAGLRATFGLLTSGQVPAQSFHGYGEMLLTAPPAPLATAPLLKAFEAAGAGSSAYGRATDQPALISQDPFAREAPPFPLLNDTDWVALQGICSV